MLQKHIDKLNHIRSMLVKLAKDIDRGYKKVLNGLEQDDADCFESIYQDFRQHHAVGKEIDNEILVALALFGAEARDLRELVAYLKITNELIRISDNIISFAKRIAPLLEDVKPYKNARDYMIHLVKSSIHSVSMAKEALNLDDKYKILTLYRNIQLEESKTDDLYSILEKSIFAELAKTKEFSIEQMDILSMTRKIERVADRAADISKLLVFATEGGELNVY